MGVLAWQVRRNLENSLVDFLTDQISNESLKVIDYDGNEQPITVTPGWEESDDWTLPVISVYIEDKSAPRSFIGNNKRIETYLLIIDIRALDDGMRSDLAEWVMDTINDGFDFYKYTKNTSDPSNPTKTKTGYVSVDFVRDTAVRFAGTADKYDKYRHNINVNLQIQESS